MEYMKVSAKTVQDAIIEASIKLGTSSDNIEYEVLETGSTGFLGFGSKPAVIQARVKKPLEDFADVLEKPVEELKKEVEESEPVKETVEEKKTDSKEESIAKAEKFLNDTFKAMKMDVTINSKFDSEDNLCIDLAGPEMGILIGKRGQTLDSIQYLTSLVVNKGVSGYIRVKIDTEDYRERRKATLENLAKNIGSKVRRTGKPVVLEPMNPYERRIIHSALQGNPYVTTHSEGEEPYRKVVVVLKK